jgi:hypothetical protein
MAQVKGFDLATSGQQPVDLNGNPVPVGVWGESNTGGGVFGTSGVLPQGTGIPIDPPAGVEGHDVDGPGVVGRSINESGVVGESPGSPGMLARSSTSSGLLGVTFSPDDGSHGVFGPQAAATALPLSSAVQPAPSAPAFAAPACSARPAPERQLPRTLVRRRTISPTSSWR